MRPASRQLGDVRATFDGLVAQWLRECRFESSLTRMTAHPAYQRIIGLGPRAVPLLLHELEHRPNHWGAALRALTGADPVPPQDAGHVHRMAARWIDWARATGIRW